MKMATSRFQTRCAHRLPAYVPADLLSRIFHRILLKILPQFCVQFWMTSAERVRSLEERLD
jgi:hypothetical protein